MSHVHYKFSSKLNYNTVVFDDVNITLSELKRLIMSREKLRAADCDLQITNAQSKEEYTEDSSPVPKGSSVIVRRVPLLARKSSLSANNSHRLETSHSSYGFYRSPVDGQKTTSVLPIFSKMADIASSDCSEADKIKTVMSQCFYDSSNYKCGAPLPANYTCYRCGSSEHHIRNCPVSLDKNAEPVRIKKSTGIPRSFLVKVDDPNIKGAMLTNTGDYAVPVIDAQVYAACKKKTPSQEVQIEDNSDVPIPDELMCLICKDLLNDAVVIPCCSNSYCDDCIRSALLDSEDHICPTCNQSDVSPDALIANKFLRQAVNNFTKEQIAAQIIKNTCSTFQTQDCAPRPSPAPTPPPTSKPEQSQAPDMPAITRSDSPPSSSSTSPVVEKTSNETPENADLKTEQNRAKSPSELFSEADTCDSLSQSIPLVTTVSQAVTDESPRGSISQSEQAGTGSPSETWTEISTVHPASTSFSVSPNITPSHIQMYLSVHQQPLNTYPSAFTTTTPSWTSGPSPQGAPIPTFTTASSTSSIPPLLPKELMLYHRRNKERTPPKGSSYQSYHSSKSHTYKSTRSSSRSPSKYRSHHRSRPYSPQSSHRGISSHSHASHSYSHSYKRSHSPVPTSSPRSHYRRRSRSPADRYKGHHHDRHYTNRSSPSSRSSRKRESSHRPRETSEWSLEEYQRRKQEYKDWCEKYFNSYFSHFHQMPPPPLMPPPQPLWPSFSSYHHKGPSPPSSDSLTSQSHSESSNSNSHSSSSYSDSHSTPTQSFSDSNSPLSDNCSRASQEPFKVKESGKQNTKDRLKSPSKKMDKHSKSKGEDKKRKDQRLLVKEKKEDRNRQSRRSQSPDSRSDKSGKRKKYEKASLNQRQNILIEPSSSHDLSPKVFEREKPKKTTWKPQPLTTENAFEGNVSVKTPQKINININLDVRKNKDSAKEAKKNIKEVHLNSFHHQAVKLDNDSEGQLIPDEEIKDEKNDSWEICPEDEAAGEEDLDLWHCALTLEEEEGKEQVKVLGLTVGPSGHVIISEDQQKMGNTRIVTHSKKKGSEKELQSEVSSRHREVKDRTKSGQEKTDSCFDFDRKRKKKTERESEGRKREERSHHKEREGNSTFYSLASKSSDGSSQKFTSILDVQKNSKSKESGNISSREGSSRKIYINLDKWRGTYDKSSSYSKSHHNNHQDDHEWTTHALTAGTEFMSPSKHLQKAVLDKTGHAQAST
ncbi:hypothetical protein WMY93_003191 [Mugilogobius chulae]|uniref:E3 ubiquitin-protein ligase RBBP6 n=1 Tax=Mugilogobius chulae TaxID=88201 RepID=A0AAW0PWR9_9GOBI